MKFTIFYDKGRKYNFGETFRWFGNTDKNNPRFCSTLNSEGKAITFFVKEIKHIKTNNKGNFNIYKTTCPCQLPKCRYDFNVFT